MSCYAWRDLQRKPTWRPDGVIWRFCDAIDDGPAPGEVARIVGRGLPDSEFAVARPGALAAAVVCGAGYVQ